MRRARAGEGVPKNAARAAELYKKACDAGLAQGCEKPPSGKR